jgi:hypothetical protein
MTAHQVKGNTAFFLCAIADSSTRKLFFRRKSQPRKGRLQQAMVARVKKEVCEFCQTQASLEQATEAKPVRERPATGNLPPRCLLY